ncbi:MAG: carboxypeptidase-like regulatory domain-containing protein [Bacteroidota bacterium]
MKRFILILFFTATGLTLTHAQNTLQGTIKDMETDKTIEGVHVFVPELQKGTITNTDGTFELNNLPEGIFKVQFSHIGYKNIIRNVTIASDTVDEIRIVLEPTVIQSEAVVISAGNYSTQHDNAIKVEMLQTREMEGLSIPSLSGKLTRIPGVSMISKGTGVTKPVIRGLSNSNILVLNNGVKLENFQFSENHPFMVDEFGTDRIEVIKGPASLLYGSDAVGGIINIIREKPAPDNTLEGDFTQKYHSNTNGYVTICPH